MTFNVNIWKLNSDENILPKNNTSHYLLDFKNSQYFSNIEKYICDIVRLKIQNIENCYIEFWVGTKDKINIHYFRDDKFNYSYPQHSFVYFFSDNNNPYVITDVDMDNYKYKDFKKENELIILYPKKNKIICFNGNLFHGFVNQHTPLSLFIQVWYDKPDIPFFNNSDCKNNDSYEFNFLTDDNNKNVYIDTSILNETFLDKILYTQNYDLFNPLLLQIKEELLAQEELSNLFIQSKIFPIQNKTFYTELENKYGEELIKDVYELLTTNNLRQENRFLKKYVITSIFTEEICKWIIQESEDYVKNMKKDWNNNINLIEINNVSNFILMSLENILKKINNIYNLNDIKMNIDSLFIIKHINIKEKHIELNKNTHLNFIIMLSKHSDFKGGCVHFQKDDKTYLLERGELLLYCNKLENTISEVNTGNMYILQCNIDILF